MTRRGSGTGSEDRFGDLAALSYRVAYRLTGDRGTAEDLCQEALARAYRSWSRVAAYDEAWVARVTANLASARPQPQDRGPPGRRVVAAGRQSDLRRVENQRAVVTAALTGLDELGWTPGALRDEVEWAVDHMTVDAGLSLDDLVRLGTPPPRWTPRTS